VVETDPRGFSSRFTRDARWGTIVTQLDIAGLTSVSVTDGMGNVVSTAYPDNTMMQLLRLWPAALGITNPDFAYATVHFDRCGANTTTFIDGAGRGVRSVHMNSNFTGEDYAAVVNTVIVDTVYGVGGLPVAVSDPFFAAGDPGTLPYPATPESAKEGVVRWSTFGYDAAWREVSMTHPDNSSQTTIYDGFSITRTDENGHVSTVIADCNSRKLRSVDAVNGTVSFAYTPWNTVQSLVGEEAGGRGEWGGSIVRVPSSEPRALASSLSHSQLPTALSRPTRLTLPSAWWQSQTPTVASRPSSSMHWGRRSHSRAQMAL
jgi:YD repeat-containing protein